MSLARARTAPRHGALNARHRLRPHPVARSLLCAAGGALFLALALALGLAPRQPASGGASAAVGAVAAEAAARAAPIYSSRSAGLLLMALCMSGGALAALAALAATSLVAPRRAQAVDVW